MGLGNKKVINGYISEQSVSTNPNNDERSGQGDEEYTGSNVYIGTTETYFRSNSETSGQTTLNYEGMNFYIFIDSLVLISKRITLK